MFSSVVVRIIGGNPPHGLGFCTLPNSEILPTFLSNRSTSKNYLAGAAKWRIILFLPLYLSPQEQGIVVLHSQALQFCTFGLLQVQPVPIQNVTLLQSVDVQPLAHVLPGHCARPLCPMTVFDGASTILDTKSAMPRLLNSQAANAL